MGDLYSKYIDSKGCVLKSNGDGGDCAQRTGTYYALKAWRGSLTKVDRINFKRAIKALQVPGQWGKYRRHWNEKSWPSQDCVMSRDNWKSIIVSMGELGLHKELFIAMLRWLCRGMFMTNTIRNGVFRDYKLYSQDPFRHHTWIPGWRIPDFAPFDLGVYIRAFSAWPLWPLLLVLDSELLVNSIIKVIYGRLWKYLPEKITRKVTKSADDINFIIELIQARKRLPTPLSWLARKIYNFRPHMKTFGRTIKDPLYETSSGPQSALQYYFYRSKNDPPLDLMFKALVETW